MNVNSWLKKASSSIDKLDAELILAHLLGKERTFLHAHGDAKLSPEQLRVADDMLLRRQKHEPLAYIFGYKEFYGRKFYLTPDVLIPRPETEALVDAVKQIHQKHYAATKSGETCKILDMGTGCGCIALSLATELNSNIDLIASDISAKALACAQYNAEKLQIKSISLIKSNLFKARAFKRQKFDIIVANLPYVDKAWPWLDKRTLAYEPKTALYAPKYGLALIKKLIKIAPKYLNPSGFLILEADISQHQAILDYAAEQGNFEDYLEDINGVQNSSQNLQSLALVLRFH